MEIGDRTFRQRRRAVRRPWGWYWKGRLSRLQYRLAPRRKGMGAWGEWLALLHLRRLRWDILTRNWVVRQGELDLIAMDGETLVFVEVKTRSGRVRPEENFSSAKQEQLERLANQFRTGHELEDLPFRTDLIAVESRDFRSFELRHWLL